jgi:hypothetical protein
MSDTESKGTQSTFGAAAHALEEALAHAERLFRDSDFDGALALLSALEEDYVHGARLFNLLGDVFLQRGETQLGIRYKVLHEVLRGTFQIAMEETQRHREFASELPVGAAASVSDAEVPHAIPVPGEPQVYQEYMPVTAAMGHELMRQGHYERALETFTILSTKNPQDLNLKKAKEHARKRCNEKRIVGMLQRWLGNLDKVKSDRSAGA